jgi:ubiquinone/menaquinone biosynthesis C-methylase UbiE
MLVKFYSKFFDPTSIAHAKKIILYDDTVPDQWETETKLTIDFFNQKNLFTKDSVVLDWGCGIGRLAKPIIEQFNCKVVGVDFQPNMLKYAKEYVDHSNFTAITNEEFFQLPDNYFTVGIFVWALQHCTNTKPIISNIQRTLKDNSKLCIFDSTSRSIPVQVIDDDYNAVKDDIVIEVPKKYHSRFLKNEELIWAHAASCADEINEYFSATELGKFPLPSQKEPNTTLSKNLDNAWWGIFSNDRKYFYT